MLVVTRSLGVPGRLIIGEALLELLELSGGKARVGVRAPMDISVARMEAFVDEVRPLIDASDPTRRETLERALNILTQQANVQDSDVLSALKTLRMLLLTSKVKVLLLERLSYEERGELENALCVMQDPTSTDVAIDRVRNLPTMVEVDMWRKSTELSGWDELLLKVDQRLAEDDVPPAERVQLHYVHDLLSGDGNETAIMEAIDLPSVIRLLME